MWVLFVDMAEDISQPLEKEDTAYHGVSDVADEAWLEDGYVWRRSDFAWGKIDGWESDSREIRERL